MIEPKQQIKPEYMQFAEDIAERVLNSFTGDEQNEICRIIRQHIIEDRRSRIEKTIEVAKILEELNAKI